MKSISKSNFIRLIGVWKTTGIVVAGQEKLKLIGTDNYELILGGNYILHRADVMIGGERSETLEVIQLDKSVDKAKMQYFNSKGENGRMNGSFVDDKFTIEGMDLKFSGTISNGDTAISGRWSMNSTDGEWVDFIELTLSRM